MTDAATGVAAIDAANDGLRFLLEQVFRPGVECRRGHDGAGCCDRSRCTRIDAIIRYLRRNFSRQEQAMAVLCYPETDHHAAQHSALIDNLCSMRDASVCADKDAARVHDFIVLWASDHVSRCDHPLGRWVRRQGGTLHL